MGKASRISSHADLNSKGDDCLSLPDNVRTGFAILEHAVTDRLDGLRSELGLVISLKDLLEGELSTCMLHRDMIQKDLSSLTEQSDALKAAYDALSYETARQQSLQAEGAVEGSRERELLQRAEESNQRIEGDLQRAQKRVQELESTPFVVAALEEQVAILLAEKTRDLSKVKSAKEEVGHWKKLAESLKQKLRDLGEQEGDNGKNFMDSFEEVMQEEMMAMKGAFESKLRCAKEDADANSKKHLQEIQRIQNTSPYASMVRLSPNL
ncbi:hypothetical protein B484DRAFT_446731 [Ochromonadaceae sp. CCMP2298]|nr:hypothetical protein B484DRAFT_446731 [Ochromonadaceae sp. CCMP2298]